MPLSKVLVGSLLGGLATVGLLGCGMFCLASVVVALVLGLPDPLDPHAAKWSNFSAVREPMYRDGVHELGEVERIMGGPGTPIPNPFATKAEPGKAWFLSPQNRGYEKGAALRGRVRFVKRDAKVLNAVRSVWVAEPAPPGEDGMETQWFRWGDEERYIIVGAAGGKAFCCLQRGFSGPSL